MTYKDIEQVKLMQGLPDDIWGNYDRQPLVQDIDLNSKIYHMSPSILAKMFITDNVMDSDYLAEYLFSKYNRSWSRLWEAIELLEYKVDETDFKQIETVRSELSEAFNTFNEGVQSNGMIGRIDSINQNTLFKGIEKMSDSENQTRNLTDKTVYNTTDSSSGKNTQTNKKGTTEKNSINNKITSNDKNTSKSNTTNTEKDKGLGSNSLNTTKQNIESASSSSNDSKTENTSGTDTKYITGTDTITDNSNETNKKSGTDTTSQTGTNKVSGTSTKSFENREDASTTKQSSDENKTEHIDTSNQNESANLNEFNETITSSGSSPLRTPQAMILEEIGVRKIQYFDIIMQDIINEICASYIE